MQRVGTHFRGFTIVELLIVIVVIAILAAITLVAYNGIRERAQVSAVQSAVSQGVKKVLAYAALNADTYPVDAAAAGLASDANTAYYVSRIGTGYCVTASTQGLTYFQTREVSSPTPGTCEGMLAWWPLNGDANDRSGNGVNGTVYGATISTGYNGVVNGAYQLGETNQYIYMGSPASFSSLSNALTYSVWVARTGTSSNQWPQIMGASDTHTGFGIRTNSYGSSIYFEWGYTPFAGASWGAIGYGSLAALNNWRHVVVTFDGSVARIYIDGVLVSMSSSTALRPGQASFSLTTATSGWQGKVDDARVYGRALSAGEIQAIYQAGAQ